MTPEQIDYMNAINRVNQEHGMAIVPCRGSEMTVVKYVGPIIPVQDAATVVTYPHGTPPDPGRLP